MWILLLLNVVILLLCSRLITNKLEPRLQKFNYFLNSLVMFQCVFFVRIATVFSQYSSLESVQKHTGFSYHYFQPADKPTFIQPHTSTIYLNQANLDVTQ